MSPDLRTLIDEALPRRELRVGRQALIDAIAERVETWQELDPQVQPWDERRKSSQALAKKLQEKLQKTINELSRLGVGPDDLQDPETRQPTFQHNPEIDLYGVCWDAMTKLRSWERVWSKPPSKRWRRAFSADLTAQLQEICRRAGLSSNEVSDLVSYLSNTNGLPTLSIDTLRKRKQRGTK